SCKGLYGKKTPKGQEIKKYLSSKTQEKNGFTLIAERIELDSTEEVKNILFELRTKIPNLVCIVGCEIKGKPSVSVIIADNLVKDKNLNAGTIIRDLAKEIDGGGGGQAFYATAGGTKLEGLTAAIEKAKALF
ncbi:MAG: DHHA1 domain-containing protein, partial [Bacteroidia bacterium]